MDAAGRIQVQGGEAARAEGRREGDVVHLTPQGDPAAVGTFTPATVLHLQRAAGNASVVSLFARSTTPAAWPIAAPRKSVGTLSPTVVQPARVTPKEAPKLRATARIDDKDAGRVIFSAPVTLAEAVAYLWAAPPIDQKAIRADPDEPSVAGRQTRFLLNVRYDLGLALSMQHGLAEAYLRRIQAAGRAASSSEPAVPIDQQLARMAWLPSSVRERIMAFERSGRFAPRSLPWSGEFPGSPPYGRIFAWVGYDDFGRRAIEFFQEYPADEAFYRKAYKGRGYAAHLCHMASVQFNRDMRYFVLEKKTSPSAARLEIRRINAEVLVLILGAVGSFYASAGGAMGGVRKPPDVPTGGVGRLGRAKPTATGTPKGLTRGGAAEGAAAEAEAASLTGQSGRIRVNAGGTGEAPGYVNLNPIKEHSGGQTRDIPNLVKRPLEEIGEAFPEGSVGELISNRLRYGDVTNWSRAAAGAYKAMSPGGKVSMNVWASGQEALALKLAFQRAGFRNVQVLGSGTSNILEAVR